MNILWVFSDELRADALGCYGGPATPVIDLLAESGVTFDRCYANSPVCVPSRVAMHTGLLPEQTGVYGNEAYAPAYPMAAVATFPEVLAAEGWTTADFGKEHVPAAITPWQHHDATGAGMLEMFAAVDPRALDLVQLPGGGVVAGRFPADVRYPPAAVVDNALAWLTSAPEPFLARASFLQPHTPVIPPEPFASRFEQLDWPGAAITDPEVSVFERTFGDVSGGLSLNEHDFRRAQAAYHASVAWLDAEIGRLLAGLDALGLRDRTVIVFASDHGTLLGEQGGFGKHTFAPASQRIPLVIVHPDLPAGTRRADLAQGIDLARTFCGLAGLEPSAAFGGRDLFGTTDPPPEIVATIGYGEAASFAYPNLGVGRWPDGRGWPRRSCVRTDLFRLDRTTRIDGAPAATADWDVFLADVIADPREVVNRAGDPALADVEARLLGTIDALADGAVETDPALVYSTTTPGARL